MRMDLVIENPGTVKAIQAGERRVMLRVRSRVTESPSIAIEIDLHWEQVETLADSLRRIVMAEQMNAIEREVA